VTPQPAKQLVCCSKSKNTAIFQLIGYWSLFEIQKYGDLPTYRLLVKWSSPDEPFAAGGDSGSLVYAKDEEVIVPLGIHIGSNGTISYSLSLWSICEEISTSLDADLFFCDPDVCTFFALSKAFLLVVQEIPGASVLHQYNNPVQFPCLLTGKAGTSRIWLEAIYSRSDLFSVALLQVASGVYPAQRHGSKSIYRETGG
jgi:hypothetical protein